MNTCIDLLGGGFCTFGHFIKYWSHFNTSTCIPSLGM